MLKCDTWEKMEPDNDVQVGTLFELYDGRRRRHMGRRIGFLSEDLMPHKAGRKLSSYSKSEKKEISKEKMTAAKFKKRLKKAR